MKKLLKSISLLLVVSMLLSLCSMSTLAAEAQKITVTANTTAIREKASTKSKQLATAKKGQSFTSTGSTKSFWKVEFKKKNDSKVYTGYILKCSDRPRL